MHELFDGQPSVGNDVAQSPRANLLVIWDDNPRVWLVTA
jgi:hypothetical protein